MTSSKVSFINPFYKKVYKMRPITVLIILILIVAIYCNEYVTLVDDEIFEEKIHHGLLHSLPRHQS